MSDEIKKAFADGMIGVITYNENEDSYQLSCPGCDYGLMNASHWMYYENKKVKVIIKIEEVK